MHRIIVSRPTEERQATGQARWAVVVSIDSQSFHCLYDGNGKTAVKIERFDIADR